MKKIFSHPPRDAKPTLWRTQNERENTPEFAESLSREFTAGATALQEQDENGLSRRDFVRLMGAATAMTTVGLTGCRRPEAHLVPFAKSAEWTIPGKFLYYASAMPTPMGAVPLTITTSDGRPTKIEGNPLHPISNGATDAFAQASILDLYDPARSKEISYNSAPVTRTELDAFLARVRAKAAQNQGEGLAILIGRENSPTVERLRSELAKQFPKMIWVEDEAISSRELEFSSTVAFGEETRPVYDFENADVILSLGSDFLNPSEMGLGFAKGFAKRRNPEGKMNRLYVVENHFSLTGGMADHRLRVRASEIGDFTAGLAKMIAEKTGDSDLSALTAAYKGNGATFNPDWIKGVADDLIASKGKCIVITGAQQPASVQSLALAINNTLGNLGSTISIAQTNSKPAEDVAGLCKFLGMGSVKTLLILGGNPVYTTPAEWNFSNMLASVPETLHLSMFADETSKVTHWQVPAAHYLESWGDTRSIDGTICSIQPMILPLWNGVSQLEILAALAGEKVDGPSFVRTTFNTYSKDTSDAAWQSFLRKGFLEESAWPVIIEPSLQQDKAIKLIDSSLPEEKGDFELVFLRSSSVDDGRYAGNSWLQETPDFVTKLVWDNAALFSPADAKKLGIKDGDMVKLSAGGKSVEIAAMIAPGHADGSISAALGYGRRGVSHVMENVGFDVYPLRDNSALCYRTGVKVEKLAKPPYVFATTQEHQNMEGRNIAREGTLALFQKQPEFASEMDGEMAAPVSIYPSPPLTSDLQWGLSMDLNTCTGCNACVVACQAENNIPVVGKDQVIKGRDMAWIRIDRWFASADHSEENLAMLPMAVMCQHCESAPCEAVCPANATVHNEEGLNLMAYNRCIGTRYCANNCPWKVRRFNWFDFNERPLDALYFGPLANKGMAGSLKMVKNPNVTVRMRGVMEKCTFCVQRIEEAKIGRAVKAGASDVTKTPLPAFKTACQQACPSESIVFGNINDPESAVSKLKANPRTYSSLKYLGTRPRVTYMARIRNPNPAMPGADMVGAANRSVEQAHA
jgi:molybdopterin-containing oxidoreductase family iron-sulfur binding subunit